MGRGQSSSLLVLVYIIPNVIILFHVIIDSAPAYCLFIHPPRARRAEEQALGIRTYPDPRLPRLVACSNC